MSIFNNCSHWHLCDSCGSCQSFLFFMLLENFFQQIFNIFQHTKVYFPWIFSIVIVLSIELFTFQVSKLDSLNKHFLSNLISRIQSQQLHLFPKLQYLLSNQMVFTTNNPRNIMFSIQNCIFHFHKTIRKYIPNNVLPAFF